MVVHSRSLIPMILCGSLILLHCSPADARAKKRNTLKATAVVQKRSGENRASDDFNLRSGDGPWLFLTEPEQPQSVKFKIYKNISHHEDAVIWTGLTHGARRGNDHIGPERKYVGSVEGTSGRFTVRIYSTASARKK